MDRYTAVGFYCYFQAILIALRSILSGSFRHGVKLLVNSVGYWRFYPNAVVLSQVRELKPRRILDVSSPKLMSLILAADHDILALDLDDPQLETRWARTAQLLGRKRFTHRFQNACAMDLPDESFEFVYSLSVIEHIPGEGDTQAMHEIARVLTPGGRAVIEVPLRLEHVDRCYSYDSKGFPLPEPRFYERHYSPATLSRLLVPELKVVWQSAMGEHLPVDPWIATPRLPRLLRLAVLPLEPYLAALNMWLHPQANHGRPLSMIFIFEKPRKAA
jgi:SAM-dependent methyltransferase